PIHTGILFFAKMIIEESFRRQVIPIKVAPRYTFATNINFSYFSFRYQIPFFIQQIYLGIVYGPTNSNDLVHGIKLFYSRPDGSFRGAIYIPNRGTVCQ